jgi:hypothetical protein
MNWDAIKNNPETKKTLHWRKLGNFKPPRCRCCWHTRKFRNPTFPERILKEPIRPSLHWIDLPIGRKVMEVSVFADGTELEMPILKKVVEGQKAKLKLILSYY